MESKTISVSEIKDLNFFVDPLLREVKKNIVGQEDLLRKILLGILADGHILLEGVPGLAKTLTIKSFSQAIAASFSRLQFTPDLLPADLLGTVIYNQKTSEFSTRKGPIFAEIVLADEINRAPAKVQSALLQAMQERQVTIGDETFQLPELFLVLATQNPIEQQGTYPLPEAQVDRFLFKLRVSYPSRDEEKLILHHYSSASEKDSKANAIVKTEQVLGARKAVQAIFMDEKIKDYIVQIIFATREPSEHAKLKHLSQWIEHGASPRASIALAKSAKAEAFSQGRNFVIPEDIKAVGHDVLRHRILLNYEAQADRIATDTLIDDIFRSIVVP